VSDEQAAPAVRSRIDGNYALGLELTDSGFDSSVRRECRTRLVQGSAEEQLFEVMLEHFRTRQLLKARGRQRTDATQVLAKVRALHRRECGGETLRQALNSLAVVVPDWRAACAAPEWVERDGPRVSDYRLPTGQAARAA
jgi:transposase